MDYIGTRPLFLLPQSNVILFIFIRFGYNNKFDWSRHFANIFFVQSEQ